MKSELIQQYVSGKLGESEAEEFEAYCVANPEFAKQVEFEQRLRAGIAQIAQGSTAEFVRSNGLSTWKYAAAACLVLVLGALAYSRWHPGGLAGNALMAAVTSETERSGPALRLAQVRGAESVPMLAPGLVRVEIVGLFDTSAHYTISLDRVQEQRAVETLHTLYGQHPASPVTLEFMLDADRLQAGSYTLRVRKLSSDEEPLDFGIVKP
jgi:hypothetical protein